MRGTLQNPESPAELLKAAYSQLEFDRGSLLSAAGQPQPGVPASWLDNGDWLSLAAQVGAEKIFFVDRDPVVVFAKVDGGSENDLRKLYERICCISRPQLF